MVSVCTAEGVTLVSRQTHTGRILLTDVDGAGTALATCDVVVMPIRREAVEAMDTAPVLERLAVLSDSAEHSRKFRGALLFSFDGYDTDRRELFQIPECCAYFRALTRRWPYWLHFLDESLIGTARAMLDDVIIVSPAGAPLVTAFFESSQADRTYELLLHHARDLRRRHRLEDS